MLGAIAGDVIGSVYEGRPVKTTAFPLFTAASTFTDDTVLTVAIADAVLNHADYREKLLEYGHKYPGAGYGGRFIQWLFGPDHSPYNSFGNGSAMRVSAIGFAFADIETVLSEARKTAEVTHNHPEGIKGAQATALAVWLARSGKSKAQIKERIGRQFTYDLNRSLDEIRPSYSFDVSCQGSVPESILAFLESRNYEQAIRLAISLGGDSDTMACIAGGIAEACYEDLPVEIADGVRARLPGAFLSVIDAFYARYMH